MHTRLIALAASILGVLFPGFHAAAQGAPANTAPAPAAAEGEMPRISGPYTHANLSIFLLHGADRLPHSKFMTLQEALQRKKARVTETGQVNELMLENLSRDTDLYIQAGDIVKGGKQDRTLVVDMILSPKSGKVPIAAFCVEQGRWNPRRGEAVATFGGSQEQVASKALKHAVRAGAGAAQGTVWQEVAKMQERLDKQLGGTVQAGASASSLQLTLEHARVQGAVDDYLKALSALPARHADAMGYAFAINGKINSVEMYASHALFLKLWPKLLKASAVEALAEPQTSAPPVAADAVAAVLKDADQGTQTAEKPVSPRASVVTRETSKNVVFETRDQEQKRGWVHRSYLTKH